MPPTWKVTEVVDFALVCEPPPSSRDPSRFHLWGNIEEDGGYRLYSVPTSTPVAEIIRFFAVGSHAALSYGLDARETVDRIADIATRMLQIVPGQPFFADPAGLKLGFQRQVLASDLDRIAALFPQDASISYGLERYEAEWDGEGQMTPRNLLKPVMTEQIFHFWWD